ncbi:MAG TPA: DUF3820 family protein [Tenuifilaceae bacterium]|nr:DUF3820 family protein [Tenuifilaceae bacterium]HPJ44660.1 DUF3820 family protein [Tenuifilaceae bacterium]HPQ32924.1 DUF3820 family protein [Tenuifilaceae bacterium]HRX66742.1 DUF3820 family protein [Tenuifilaceae bacterium]
MEDLQFTAFNRQIFRELKTATMPFGKYKGKPIKTIPEYYLVWLKNKGFPKGKLGTLLSTMLEVRVNGLEKLLND